ncbi:MAG: hypothetical protein GX876_01210 [Bacteroidales bacterium]|nr:hypothetical protein [Bacteroidales bacterium]
MFEVILNHVGLHSEHIHIGTGELYDNFPHVYYQLGLIQSALLLNGEEVILDNEIFRYIKP